MTLLTFLAPALADPSAYTLAAVEAYPVDTRPAAARIADVNGDGALDVVVASSETQVRSNELLVFPQLADGTLGTPTSFPFGGFGSVYALDVGDLDGDSVPDAVVTGWGTGTVAFYGDDHGAFDGPFSVDERDGLEVLLTDVDGDGDDDLVTVPNGEGLYVYTNDGAGGLTERMLSGSAYGVDMAHADVTGDDVADLVSAGPSWAWMVNVYAGRGDGTFDEMVSWSEGRPSLAGALATGDFDGDGAGDVAVAGDGNSPVSLYVFSSGGGAATELESYDIPSSMEAGDLDGDGDDDLVVAHHCSSVTVHLQEDDGLAPHVRYATPLHGELGEDSLAIGDVSGDGCADVVVADAEFGLLVLRGQRCGETIPPDPGDTGDTGDAAEDTATDTADTADTDTRHPVGSSEDCGCAAGGGAGLAWLGALAFLGRRRR